MFPHEAQELMAKILFFVFATCILALSKVQAADLASHSLSVTPQITISLSK